MSELVDWVSERVLKSTDSYSQVGLGGTDNGGQFSLVLALDVLNGQDSSSLLMDNGAKTSLALDDNVGNTHLSAEGRKIDNQLDRVNIVSNDD